MVMVKKEFVPLVLGFVLFMIFVWVLPWPVVSSLIYVLVSATMIFSIENDDLDKNPELTSIWIFLAILSLILFFIK